MTYDPAQPSELESEPREHPNPVRAGAPYPGRSNTALARRQAPANALVLRTSDQCAQHPVRAVCSRTSVRAPTRSTLGYSIRVGLATLVSGPYGQSVKRFLNSFNFVCCSLYVFGRARRAKPATAHLRGLRTHTHLWVYDVWGCVANLGPKLCGRLSRLG